MVLLSGMREGFCEERAGALFHSTDNAAYDTGARLQDVRLQDRPDQQKCMKVFWGLQIAVAVTAVVTTTAQWMLAMRIRTYAKLLAKRDRPSPMVEQQRLKGNVYVEENGLL